MVVWRIEAQQILVCKLGIRLTRKNTLIGAISRSKILLFRLQNGIKIHIISEQKVSQRLVEVTQSLACYKEITKAMWAITIEDKGYIYTFEQHIDEETGILTAETSWALKEQKQDELDEFITSQNVHRIILQETKQLLYVESKTDLHAEFEILEHSQVRVSGYSIKFIDNALWAEFSGKWYKLEQMVQKDSDIGTLLSKVIEAMKNGQTAFTVTTHGISAATSKKGCSCPKLRIE